MTSRNEWAMQLKSPLLARPKDSSRVRRARKSLMVYGGWHFTASGVQIVDEAHTLSGKIVYQADSSRSILSDVSLTYTKGARLLFRRFDML